MLAALTLVGTMLLTPAATPPVKEKAPQEFVFPDEVVGGGSEGPGGEIVTGGQPKSRHPSLLRVRESFAEHVLQSVSEM